MHRLSSRDRDRHVIKGGCGHIPRIPPNPPLAIDHTSFATVSTLFFLEWFSQASLNGHSEILEFHLNAFYSLKHLSDTGILQFAIFYFFGLGDFPMCQFRIKMDRNSKFFYSDMFGRANDLWPFDLGDWSVVNPSTEFENPTTIDTRATRASTWRLWSGAPYHVT